MIFWGSLIHSSIPLSELGFAHVGRALPQKTIEFDLALASSFEVLCGFELGFTPALSAFFLAQVPLAIES